MINLSGSATAPSAPPAPPAALASKTRARNASTNKLAITIDAPRRQLIAEADERNPSSASAAPQATIKLVRWIAPNPGKLRILPSGFLLEVAQDGNQSVETSKDPEQ